MERSGHRADRARGIELKQRRNLKMQLEFYDEETDVMEWSAHQAIFEVKSNARPEPPTPAGPAAAAGGVVPPPPAAQGAAAAAAADAAPPLPPPALPGAGPAAPQAPADGQE